MARRAFSLGLIGAVLKSDFTCFDNGRIAQMGGAAAPWLSSQKVVRLRDET